MSPLFSSRPEGVTNIRQRAQGWLTALNLHWAGLALLAAINLYLLLLMGIAWQRANNQNEDAFARQQVALKTAQIAAQPLQGLDVKLADSNTEAAAFYRERLPDSYSEVAAELGALAQKQHVLLTRVQYSQAAVADDAAGQLTEVRMDANLSGDYRSLVLFINHMERDKLFFLISGLTLTGQQSGQVNLRLRVTTYLHGVGSVDEMKRVSLGDAAGSAAESAPSSTESAPSPTGGAQ